MSSKRLECKHPPVQLGILFTTLLLSICAWAQDPVVKGSGDISLNNDWLNWYNNYATNQFVVQMPFTQENAQRLKSRIRLYQYRLLYVPTQSLTNAITPTIRIGLFPSKSEAEKFIGASDFLFKGQSISRIPLAEHQAVTGAVQPDNNIQDLDYFVFAIGDDVSAPFEQTNKVILDRAKSLYMNKQYQQAINHYRILIAIADSATAAWAKELVGLCYEKLGQYALAIETYTTILKDYPDLNGKSRVEQRLRGLETAAEDGRTALRKSSYSDDSQNRFFIRGDLGQYHRSLTSSSNGVSDREVMSLLSTDFDFRASAQMNGHNVRGRVNGFWIKDQLDNDNSELRLKRVYVDYQHQNTGTNVIIGRQKEFNSGVFTSFDGVTASYPIVDNVKVSASVGKPIYFADVYEKLDYFFYSAHTQWDINKHWRINAYYTTQTLNDVTDREAIGFRGQYNNETISSAVNIDFDKAFGELNNLLWNIGYNFSDRRTLNFVYGKQRSPFLTATNILIGQADLDLEVYLQSKQNVDSLLDDAFARTALNTYYSLSLNNRIGDKGRLIVDYYQSDLTEIPSTELLTGQTITVDNRTEFSQSAYGLQLIIQDVFYKNDSTSMGLRQTTGSTSSSSQIFFDERLRFGNVFTIAPKISFSEVDFESGRDTQQQLRYSLSLTYKPFRNTELNLETGNESVSIQQSDLRFDSNYFFAGYRVNF